MSSIASAVTDNPSKHRYEARVGDAVAFANYRRGDGVIEFTHTEVPDELQGHGIANDLAKHALDQARADGLRVIPTCEFFSAYIARHPAYSGLVGGV